LQIYIDTLLIYPIRNYHTTVNNRIQSFLNMEKFSGDESHRATVLTKLWLSKAESYGQKSWLQEELVGKDEVPGAKKGTRSVTKSNPEERLKELRVQVLDGTVRTAEETKILKDNISMTQAIADALHREKGERQKLLEYMREGLSESILTTIDTQAASASGMAPTAQEVYSYFIKYHCQISEPELRKLKAEIAGKYTGDTSLTRHAQMHQRIWMSMDECSCEYADLIGQKVRISMLEDTISEHFTVARGKAENANFEAWVRSKRPALKFLHEFIEIIIQAVRQDKLPDMLSPTPQVAYKAATVSSATSSYKTTTYEERCERRKKHADMIKGVDDTKICPTHGGHTIAECSLTKGMSGK